jgi:hypothetical protein
MNNAGNKLAGFSFASLMISLILLVLVVVVVKFLAERFLVITGLIALVVFNIVLYNYLKIRLAKWERDRAWKKLERDINAELDAEFELGKARKQKSQSKN